MHIIMLDCMHITFEGDYPEKIPENEIHTVYIVLTSYWGGGGTLYTSVLCIYEGDYPGKL